MLIDVKMAAWVIHNSLSLVMGTEQFIGSSSSSFDYAAASEAAT